MRGDRSGGGYGIGQFIGAMIAQILLGFLAAIIVNKFSRYREFHADNGGARLSSNQNMINVLKALQRASSPDKLKSEFATHPPMEDRIAALEANQ